MAERTARHGSGAWFAWIWLPVLVYLATIFFLGTRQHLQPPFRFENSDKFWHLLEYFGLGILLARAMRATLRRSVPLGIAFAVVAFGTLVGAADEFVQSFVPGRESSLSDLGVDFVAVAFAQLGYRLIVRD